MDRAEQSRLLEELRELHARKVTQLDAAVAASPVSRYLDRERFEREQARVFRRLPQILAHASELPAAGSCLRRTLAGLPVLLTRDEAGEVHAFLNVCRHRGTRLVSDVAGCRQRFSCPYHGWTWTNRGELVAIPHRESGFPDAEQRNLGLRRLQVAERHGWIWACADGAPDASPDPGLDVDAWLGSLADDFAWLDAGALELRHDDEQTRHANWKILTEGGLEAYHFKVAHRRTIGPYFHDNLSSYERHGPHFRSILPKVSLGESEAEDAPAPIREHAQVLYTLTPGNALLVQSDHIAWIRTEPLAPATTRLRIATLAPRGDTRDTHWQRNHQITVSTLNEDYDLAESIQDGLSSGANEVLLFGRYEGALDAFNAVIDALLAEGDS